MVLGAGRITCPFCAATVQLRIVRHLDQAPTVEARAVQGVGAGGGGRFGPSPSPPLVEPETPAERAEEYVRARDLARDAFSDARFRALSTRDHEPDPIPWENGRLGLGLGRWLATVGSVLLGPRAFFNGLGAERWGRAPSFAAVQLAFAVPVVASALAGDPAWRVGQAYAALVAGLALVCAWFIVAARLCVRRRIRWSGAGRVAAYGLAPFVVVPVTAWGPMVAAVWSMALHAVGLQRVFGLPGPVAGLIASAPAVVSLIVLWSLNA